MIATVLDTGPLAAAFNAADRRHPECASLLASLTGRRLLPSPVMTEVCWLLERWPKVEQRSSPRPHGEHSSWCTSLPPT
ncbi:hypothetical protein ACFU3E_30155 [Streptomyces sp. NPDC057424]|uniref:hypothetical protein n=1 Tax=Streptomyces sp. NPDC057424 TaxID=3346127 RepID=UPI0036A33130